MTKTLHAVFLLALACPFALCTALPYVSARTEPNVPRTLLGRPYQRRWENTQRCMPSRWTVVLADCTDTDASTHGAEARIGNGGWMQTRISTTPRVPLVVDMVPESEWVRLRLTRKRPMGCSDDAPWSAQGESEGMTPKDAYEQRVQSPVVVMPDRLCDVTVPVGLRGGENGHRGCLQK